MERWIGKIAIVTGASSGIGLAIAKALVQNDVVVIGFARKKSKMQSEMQNVKGKNKGQFYACECDITKPESIEQAFQWVKNNFKTVHILVNNAGIIINSKFMDSSRSDWKRLFDINVLGFIDCTKRAARMMLDSNVEGYIINMNSIAGHNVICFPGYTFNFYSASKFASVAATEITQKELHGSKIRVTNSRGLKIFRKNGEITVYLKLFLILQSISPGYVSTEILQVANFNVNTFKNVPALEADDIANAVIYVIGTPQRVHITELIIRPFGEVKYEGT
ncbi:farnesol dehydrogenase-like [Vespa crabro]|uniref:farnesol dehydrogenase-like n=1 Tax=Vespa crabro TaxID=7445 RepID=UPI001F02C019|nr:farnesol dehydrogenase-like [Vespa crabro]